MKRTHNPLPSAVSARFWNKVEITGFCWNWTGAKQRTGYGNVRIDSVYYRPHRVAYRVLVGEFDEELVIDHLCRNPSCVNPDHLEPVEERVNIRRGFAPTGRNSRATHCPRGHEYTSVNTYLQGENRSCVKCRKVSSDAHNARKRAARRAH